MKILIVCLIILATIHHNASAQKVPRPGGGGEDIEVNGEKYSKSEFESFYRLFKNQQKKCDPKRKVKIDFGHIYNYLFQRHFEAMMKLKHLEKRPHEYCHHDSRETIDCILNRKMKQSLGILIRNNSVEDYFKKQKDLSKKETHERIEFLNHLVEK